MTSLRYTHMVVAEYSYGLEIREAELKTSADDALDVAERLQAGADKAGIPVVYRVYALSEIRRGHVPANERIDLDG
jgi:hypothetical protein